MFNLVQTCSDAPSALWGILDFSIAPSLLFYSYIPIIVISLFLGGFVLSKEKYSLRSKLLFTVSIIFTLLLLNEILLWIAAPVTLVEFGWQLEPLFRILVAVLTVYFVDVFFSGKDLPFLRKLLLSIPFVVVVLLTPSASNISFFDLNNCEGVPGLLFDLTHAFEVLSMLWVAVLTIKNARRVDITKNELHRDVFLGVGATLFLVVFFASTYFGDATKVYQIGLLGPIGMVVFMAFLTFVIVRYKAFDIKLVGAQALIVSLVVLIGSEFFFIQTNTNRILTAITLIITGIIGLNLIRSVKKEVAQREELALVNQMQADTASLITHQIRGVFANTKSGLSNIIEGTYGAVPPDLMNILNLMFKSQVVGVDTVETFLRAQKIENGTVQYDKKSFDLRAVVEQVSTEEKPTADAKGLQYEVQIEAGDYTLSGDKVYLTQVISNLIDNAIRYTPKGSVAVHLSRTATSVRYSVKDSGIGIPEEDKGKMFTKYGHGKDPRKTNAASSGLGLYIVKGIVVGHGGKIWYETEVGKGTTFFVELPVT